MTVDRPAFRPLGAALALFLTALGGCNDASDVPLEGTVTLAVTDAPSDELAALVDTRDTFDPESAARLGLDLSRLLWVRGGPVTSADSREATIERQVDRAVKALTLILQAGGFGLVALDLADVPDRAVRALPFTTWLRLARLVEGSRTACVLVGTRPIARSPGGATIALEAGVAGSTPQTAASTAGTRHVALGK